MAERKTERVRLVDNPKGKSAVWRSFMVKKVGGKFHTEDAVFSSCKATIKTGGGTSNLAQHIRRYHPLKQFAVSKQRKKEQI